MAGAGKVAPFDYGLCTRCRRELSGAGEGYLRQAVLTQGATEGQSVS